MFAMEARAGADELVSDASLKRRRCRVDTTRSVVEPNLGHLKFSGLQGGEFSQRGTPVANPSGSLERFFRREFVAKDVQERGSADFLRICRDRRRRVQRRGQRQIRFQRFAPETLVADRSIEQEPQQPGRGISPRRNRQIPAELCATPHRDFSAFDSEDGPDIRRLARDWGNSEGRRREEPKPLGRNASEAP